MYNNSSTGPLAKLETPIEEGDILGVFYDHSELCFAINGVHQYVRPTGSKATQTGVTGVRGTVYPVFAVGSGAILDVRFTSFQHPPRNGFTEILMEHDIL